VDEVSFVGTTRMTAAATPTTNNGYRYCILIVIDDQDKDRISMPPQIHHPTSGSVQLTCRAEGVSLLTSRSIANRYRQAQWKISTPRKLYSDIKVRLRLSSFEVWDEGNIL
jgi:hypothetical protein